MHAVASYGTPELRRIAEHPLITSFCHFLPMSDSVYIVSEDPSLLVLQVAHFMVNCFWLRSSAFEFPEATDPRTVNVADISRTGGSNNGKNREELWLPVLFRGGMSSREVRIYDAPNVSEGKLTHRQNILGKGVIEAVSLEKSGAKGPVLLCPMGFDAQLTNDAKKYVGKIEIAGKPFLEVCWPIALFETAENLNDALNNEFGRFLRVILNLLKYFSRGPFEAHYLDFGRLAIRSALQNFPSGRDALAAHIERHAVDSELISCLLGVQTNQEARATPSSGGEAHP